MNREIKFRAWDKKNNCWLTDKDNVYLSEEGEYFLLARGAASDYLSRVDVDIVFWTGLLDKNGKEVYEGDIVNYSDKYIKNKIYEVPLLRDCFLTNSIGYELEQRLNAECEIIGNIYENPTLLQ